jgi:hypothetical protein
VLVRALEKLGADGDMPHREVVPAPFAFLFAVHVMVSAPER